MESPPGGLAENSAVPSVAFIRDDREQGSVALSYRALEVIRDRAGWLTHQTVDHETATGDLRVLAQQLLAARPSMAVLCNRIHCLMHACRDNPSAEAIEREAGRVLEKAYADDAEAARHAESFVAGRRVLTLSRSGTVLQALSQAEPAPVSIIIAASRPGGEGVVVAETLAMQGISVTLISDAALASVFAEAMVDVVVVGADTVLPNGDVVNKVGTRIAAMLARHHHVPCYVVASTDKVSTRPTPHLEYGPPDDLYRGTAPLEPFNPIFEVTPGRLFSGVITEEGVLAPIEMQDVAFEHKALERW